MIWSLVALIAAGLIWVSIRLSRTQPPTKVFPRPADPTNNQIPTKNGDPIGHPAPKNDLPAGPLPWRLPLGQVWLRIEAQTIHHQTQSPCWNFCTEGMTQWKQQELVLCVERLPGEKELDFPREIVSLFRTLCRLGSEGKVVRAGDYTVLGTSILRDDFFGIIYTDAIEFPGHSLPPNHLRMVVVTRTEIEVAQTQGPTRVLNLIGAHHHFFPTAAWVDRRRPSVVPAAAASSLLNRLPSGLISAHLSRISAGMSVTAAAGSDQEAVLPKATVEWTILKGANPGLADHLNQFPICFLMLLDPTADAALCWVPARPVASVIVRANSQGKKMGANFLVLTTHSSDDLVGAEDGFVLMMRPSTVQQLTVALREQKDLELHFGDGSDQFRLRWIETDYLNPVDGTVLTAPSGWQHWHPETTTPKGPIQLLNIRLLQPIQEIAANIDQEVLASFLKQATNTVEKFLIGMPGHYELIVQLSLTPNAPPDFKISSNINPDSFDSKLLSSLAALQPPVCTGLVKVNAHYRVDLDKFSNNLEN